MLAPLAGLYETAASVLADLPHQAVGDDEWAVPAEYAQFVEQMGLEFRTAEDGTVHLNPKQPVLVVSQPVTDILAQFEVPYQTAGSQVLVDLAELAVPTVYGQSTEP
jgi:hypothetical protein